MDTLSKLQEIFHDIFDDNTIVLSRETTANDIEGWDSFTHINIIVTCENEFGVKFNLSEIANLKNVGNLVDLIEKK